jgi:glycosyltransferase involved in cell wall biosynthesis
VRICLVYDCLYPHTIGGAERWYRDIAARLVAAGHDVTYLTLRQWDRGEAPQVPAGVSVVTAGPRMALYTGGRRRILPPLVFGIGVLWYLLRHGRRYDAVQTASFPYFSLLAAGVVRPLGGFRLLVDWHEVWSRAYWRSYLGGVGGRVGELVQRLCMRPRQEAFCPSRLQEQRLRREGFRWDVTVLDGRYEGSLDPAEATPAEPLVVFAGRHIPEKEPGAVVAAVARARERLPELRGLIFGDGPERDSVLELIRKSGADGAIEAPGFVAGEVVEDAMKRALCVLFPSQREGYGLVVVESAHRGTPIVLVRGPDNAAVELVSEGENGFVADSLDPDALADAIVRVHDGGLELRRSTADWFNRNARRLSLDTSLELLLQRYAAR